MNTTQTPLNHHTCQQARMARDPRFDGQFFVAVKTTGIFCRPICPAVTPKEHNVEYFPIAQLAMQAGYRPCLRCRPDSAPESWAWKGVDTTIERAIRLLAENLSLPLSQIADKLGISDRYLRQLFKDKLGISPKQYQLFEQLLFAKQLLHQSSLPVEQVAQASGFNSARRLQAHMQTHAQLSPVQIRRKSDSASGYLNKELNLTLAFRPPYNWPQVREFLARRAINGMEAVTENSYSRTIPHGYFSATYQAAKQRFALKIQLDDIRQLKHAVGQIRRILDLNADTCLIEQQLVAAGISKDKLQPGLRIPGIWNTFEAGCRAVLGQQISVTAAINLVQTLVQTLGEKSSEGYHFPTPQQVAGSDLAFLKMPASRRATLIALAEHCCDPEAAAQPDSWLTIKGIGPWTVAYSKMRGQSMPDIWLGTDLVIKKQLEQYKVNSEIAAPWRSYLTFQLWSMA